MKMVSNGGDEGSVFVPVAAVDGSDDVWELQTEDDGSMLMSTLEDQFPGAAGLKYKGSTGAWRAVKIANDILMRPSGGWGDTTYTVLMSKDTLKKKAEDEEEKEEETAEEPEEKKEEEEESADEPAAKSEEEEKEEEIADEPEENSEKEEKEEETADEPAAKSEEEEKEEEMADEPVEISEKEEDDTIEKDAPDGAEDDTIEKDASDGADDDTTEKDASDVADDDMTEKVASDVEDDDMVEKVTSDGADEDITEKVASDGADNNMVEKVASDGADEDMTEKVASDGADDDMVVNVALEDGSDDIMEIPTEPDEKLLLSTLQGQFPNAMGLKFKTPAGAWRAVRIVKGALNPPNNGWGAATYIVTINKESLKRKAEETPEEPVAKAKKEATPEPKKKEVPVVETKKVEVPLGTPAKSEKYLLEDLAVIGIPFNYTDKELREYFTKNCGDLSYCVIKFDRNTKKSRGFGFIRFKTVEGAKKALAGSPHKMAGREVKVQTKKEEPFKLFVGKIRETTTSIELKEHFGQYGEVTDVYIPTPFRGYAFVTYMYKSEGRLALDRIHVLKGARLNVSFAEPKEEKEVRLRLEKLEEVRRAEHEFLLRGGADAPGNAAEETKFFDIRRNTGRPAYKQARAEEYLGPGRGDGGYGLNSMGVRDVRDSDARRGPMDGLSGGVRGPLDGGMRSPRDTRGDPRDMRSPRDMRGSRDMRGPRDMGSDARDSFNLQRNLKEANDRFSPRGPQRNFQQPPLGAQHMQAQHMQAGLQNMLVSLLAGQSNY